MFFLRLTLAITLSILATSDANAQLFRFRQRAQRAPQQIPQTPSRFNPNTYQYTQLPRPQTNVPSTPSTLSNRYATQTQPTNYYRPQVAATNVAPAKVNPRANAQRVAATNVAPVEVDPQAGQRVVMMTLRDPRTGQLYQRPYLVTNPQPAAQQPQPQPQQQVAMLPMKPIDNGAQLGVSSVVVQAPVNAAPRSVAQTTFESPILDPVEPAKKEFSIFEEPSQSAPELQATVPTAEVATTEPQLDEPEPTQTVAAEPTLVEPVLAEPKLELELDLDESPSVDPEARTRALPFDSAGELDLDIEFAPLNPQN